MTVIRIPLAYLFDLETVEKKENYKFKIWKNGSIPTGLICNLFYTNRFDF